MGRSFQSIGAMTEKALKPYVVKSDGQEKSTKILISWQELKNQFLSFLFIDSF